MSIEQKQLSTLLSFFHADWACTAKNTGWNKENSKSFYLDRHNIACGANEVLKRFKLQRNYKGSYMYQYKCCNPNFVASSTVSKETPPNDDGGGNTVYLDRHHIDCGNDMIAQMRLNRPRKGFQFFGFILEVYALRSTAQSVSTGHFTFPLGINLLLLQSSFHFQPCENFLKNSYLDIDKAS